MLEWQNRTLSIFPLFRKMPPLAKSKWGLKVHPATYHICIRKIR